MADVIRIAAIDNDPMVLLGQRALIDPVPDLSLVCTSTDVEGYLAAGLPADVVLLDLMLGDDRPPEENVALLCATGTRVLVVSVHGDRQHVRATIRAGASGYLIKGGDRAALTEAIRTVHAGDQALTVVPCAPTSIVACGSSIDRTTLGIAASWKTVWNAGHGPRHRRGIGDKSPSISSTRPGQALDVLATAAREVVEDAHAVRRRRGAPRQSKTR